MFDPLSDSATPFANDDRNPSWPTSPQEYNSSESPNLNRTESSLPPTTPQKGPSDGLYGREPQIYGQPEPGLISPAVGSNGTKYERTEPYLRVRITGLDRNRRDILVRLDAQVRSPCPMDLTRLIHKYRPTYPILRVQRTETCHVHTWNANNFTKLSYKTTLKRLYLPSLLPKHPHLPTKKMTGWSK
jgi:hypothetical protein